MNKHSYDAEKRAALLRWERQLMKSSRESAGDGTEGRQSEVPPGLHRQRWQLEMRWLMYGHLMQGTNGTNEAAK
jgi:hypothetical protein